MRLRSVFKMRTSILNTVTTEQMGYIIFSFFVYIKSTNSLSFRSLNAIQLRTTFFSGVCRPPLSHRLNNWFRLESTNRRTKILYEIECDVGANKNAGEAFSMPRLPSHSISYKIFVLRLFTLINQYMKSLFYRCNWKKVHVILK